MPHVEPGTPAERLWCRNQRLGGFRPFPPRSGDSAGDRHAEAGHDVDDLAGDFGLGLLCRQTSGIKAVTYDLCLESAGEPLVH